MIQESKDNSLVSSDAETPKIPFETFQDFEKAARLVKRNLEVRPFESFDLSSLYEIREGLRGFCHEANKNHELKTIAEDLIPWATRVVALLDQPEIQKTFQILAGPNIQAWLALYAEIEINMRQSTRHLKLVKP